MVHRHRLHEEGVGTGRRALERALFLILVFMAAEVVAGILAHSLALLSDAAHMLTDAAALALSLVALRLAARPAGGNLTFGLRRMEILSAQANGFTLLVLAGLIVYESVRRLITPPEPGGLTILVVALVGVAVSLAATMQLARADSTSSPTSMPSSPRQSRAPSSSPPASAGLTGSPPSSSRRSCSAPPTGSCATRAASCSRRRRPG